LVAVTPALLTTAWIRPNFASASAIAASIFSATVTSSTTLCALPPDALISSTAEASASARRAASVTLAPLLARKRAKWRPKPLDPPVTRMC
jgi:hypothetical protein